MLDTKKKRCKNIYKLFLLLSLFTSNYSKGQQTIDKNKKAQVPNYFAYNITASTTKNKLEQIIQKAKKETQVLLEFKTVAYNKEKKISKIHIDYTDPTGQTGSFVDLDNDKPIREISIAIEVNSNNKFKQISFLDTQFVSLEDVIEIQQVKKLIYNATKESIYVIDDIPYKNSDLIGKHYMFQGVDVISSREALLKFDINSKEGLIVLNNAKKINTIEDGIKLAKKYSWYFTNFIEFRNNLKPNLIMTSTPNRQ